ncbi:hypothetical protein AAHA92_11083 [Salvia divinorum]|uniref:Serine-rich protein-like protein n=1 Tax=Salvia divinorum TaxID=28513 RepID=A0ABD1HZC2_SALDI
MAEESTNTRKREKPTISIPNPSITAMNAVSRASSVPTSPVGLANAKTLKSSCLCSPTTHAGSFRCRYHRNTGLMRNSISVGAKLSELGADMPVPTKLGAVAANSDAS